MPCFRARPLSVVLVLVLLVIWLGAAAAVPRPASGKGQSFECPAVAVVAARGSEQAALEPVRYAPASQWVSTGYEGENISGLLTYAGARHHAATGEHLFHDVPVLGLPGDVYPAAMPLPALINEGEDPAEIPPREIISRVQNMLHGTTPGRIAHTAASAFLESLHAGISGAPGFLQSWEQDTGCRPDYLLVGYSQGAMVLTTLEASLHQQGRLAGVVYLGNPLVTPGDPSVVGVDTPVGGMAAWAATTPVWAPAPGVDKRLNYCTPRDVVCHVDVSGSTQGAAGAHPNYFLGVDPVTAADDKVADTLAQWISAATSRERYSSPL